ncbi:acyl-CoA dehydrogenase family protein [Xanthobacter aminoxidans]|uniref:acyl-CoA dehydrogenase family protein n=1 Tax=Xanthobacter aminoxidans TaxID=186280 RepID=UPI002022CF2E|nr:acyl-CoA dehydrogenase family protein [Xanthobacter aminoxidans]MCL8383523.1 acyl-CoA/acyl-ACP dehydrogenase [Xanthobacter aminoxidans]
MITQEAYPASQTTREMQDQSVAVAESVFGDLVTRDVLEQAEAGQFPVALWATLSELGFQGACLPEAEGGLGGLAEGLVLLRPAGRFTVPAPLPETMVAAWILDRVGFPRTSAVLTFAPAREDEALPRITPSNAGGYLLSGAVNAVPWARCAHLAMLALDDGMPRSESRAGLFVVSVDPSAARLVKARNVAHEPRDTVIFDAVPLPPEAVRPAPAFLTPGWIACCGAVMRALQMAGALDGLLDGTVRYANDRVQFGRPIGKFQAIQQMVAVMAAHVAAAGMAAELGLAALARNEPLETLAISAAVAKIRAGEAATAAAAIAHQVHGAMGFTHEHTLHYTTRRLWAWREDFGREAVWAERLGRQGLAAGADHLWAFSSKA